MSNNNDNNILLYCSKFKIKKNSFKYLILEIWRKKIVRDATYNNYRLKIYIICMYTAENNINIIID